MRGTRTPDFHGKGPGFNENPKTLKPMADTKKHRCPCKQEFQNLSRRWCGISAGSAVLSSGSAPSGHVWTRTEHAGSSLPDCSAPRGSGSEAPGRTGASPLPAPHPAAGRTCLVFYFFNPLPQYLPLIFRREWKGRGETHRLAACRQRPYGPGSQPQPRDVPCTPRPARPWAAALTTEPGRGTLSLSSAEGFPNSTLVIQHH